MPKVSQIHKTKEFRHKQKIIKMHNLRHILEYVKIKQNYFLLIYLIAFVELYIKTHNCNSLMNNRRIVVVNIQNNSKIASLTYLMGQNSCVNSRHFCHTEDVKNNRSSGLNILEEVEFSLF